MLGDGEIIDTYLVEKREGVDTKSDKYDIGVTQILLVLFSVTQSFLLGSSEHSDNITASNKKNIFKSLSVYLR